MGNSIRLGNVTISDVNFNNQFDPGMDLVTNSFGKVLTAQARAKHLGKILNFLQVPRWRGVRLLEAGRYLDYFSKARRQAHFGKVFEAKKSIHEAEAEAKGMGIPFNQIIAKQVLKDSLIKGSLKQIHLAKNLLTMGANPREALKHLLQAEKFNQELQNKFNFKIRAMQGTLRRLLKKTLQKALPSLLKEAQSSAAAGDIISTEALLQDLRHYAQEAKQRFQIKFNIQASIVDKIMITAYVMGIPSLHQIAWNLASQGQTLRVRGAIRRMKSRFQEAQQLYGLKFNLQINWADLILEEALIKGIDDNLRLALGSARQKRAGHQRWIRLAERYVREYNFKFAIGNKLKLDPGVLGDIQDCARGLIPCPSPGSLPPTQRP